MVNRQLISDEVWNDNYRAPGENSLEDTWKRQAKACSEVENESIRQQVYEDFLWLLTDFKGIAGGRITANLGVQGREATSLMNCFIENTKVLTSCGYKKINEISIGELVLTHKGNWKRVINTIKRHYIGNVDVYTSTYLNNSITVTPEHPFYQGNNEWVQSKDNNILSFPIQINNHIYHEIDIFDYINDLKNLVVSKDKLYTKNNFTGGNNAPSFKTSAPINRHILINEEFAYILGRFIGDGSVYSTSNKDINGINIVFSNKEKTIMPKINQMFLNVFGISLNENLGNTFSYLRKNNIVLAYFIYKLIGKGFKNKSIPSIILTANKSVRKAFLLGLLDADGCVTKLGHIQLVLANEQLIDDTKFLFNSINIFPRKRIACNKHVKNASDAWMLFINHSQTKEIIDDLSKVYDDTRISRPIDLKYQLQKNNDVFTFSNFEKSSHNYDGFVYNLSVEDDESYVVEGVVTHNCFVHAPSDINYTDPDSITGIYDMLKAQAQTLKSEGGYGMNFSWIRPAGAYVKGIGGRTPGVLKFMELWDKSSEVITMGSEKVSSKKKSEEKRKIRKGAQMAVLNCTHPEIEDFIAAKQTEGRFTKFNISVGICDGFMDAVQNDLNWDLVFPDTTVTEYKDFWKGNIDDWKSRNLPVVVYKTVKARDLWDKIMRSTYNRNDPGVLFLDIANKLNPLYYAENIATTNPCFHGDTLIAVADGRNAVTIKELAESGQDVPVYSISQDGVMEIKWGRHPRVTGYDKDLIRVHLDDGSYLDVTENHEFVIFSTSGLLKKQAKELVRGDSLAKFQKTKEPVVKNGKPYFQVCLNNNIGRQFEHRIIAKFYYNNEWTDLHNTLKSNGFAKTGGIVVHHKDYNQLNNAPDNLQIMTFKEHAVFHGQIDQAGEKNGKFSGFSNEEIIEYGIELTKKLGRKFSLSEWQDLAIENKLPQNFSNWRKNTLGTIGSFAILCATKCGFENAEADPRTQDNCNELLSQGYDAYIENNNTFVRKICENCGTTFSVVSHHREKSFCQHCSAVIRVNANKYYDNNAEDNKLKQSEIYSSLKFSLGRKPMRKEWESECRDKGIPFRLKSKRSFYSWKNVIEAGENFNHKVVSIEKLPGKHTVYNITVDDNHTLAVITTTDKSNRIAYDGVFTHNCGEIGMGTGVCLLLSMNLVKYIKCTSNNTYEFDFDTFKKASQIAVRFADNINDISRVPLDDYKKAMIEKRRVGIGVVGLGSMLAILGLRYGSPESLELIEKIFKIKAETEILTSAKLGKEKGSFPLFDKEKYFNSYWWKTLPISDDVKKEVEEIGCIRNSHRSANAPTGNMSLYAGVLSGGIEPIFLLEYARWAVVPEGDRAELRLKGFSFPDVFKGEWFETDLLKKSKAGTDEILIGEFNGVKYQVDKNRGLTKRSLVEDFGWSFIKENFTEYEIKLRKESGLLATAGELSQEEHINVLKVIAKYIDMNSSKTIGISNDYPYESFKHIYMDAWKAGIKGVTTYREGTMTAVLESVNTKAPKKDHEAPKRPKELLCNIHTAKVDGKKWIVLIGLQDNKPYEIFAGPAENLDIKNGQVGRIIKFKRGEYCLEINGEILSVNGQSNIVDMLDDNSSAWATRLVSMSLRHNVPIQFICEQLNKDGYITDINKVLSRILRKYIIGKTTDQVCPECGSKNIKLDPCFTCMDCNYGKCG